MRRTEPHSERKPVDWRAWLALAWALWFGGLYVLMVLNQKAPGLMAAIRSRMPG